MYRIHAAALLTLIALTAWAAAPPKPAEKSPVMKPVASEGEAPVNPRMQKLQQLQFDRRPSAQLRAWAPLAAKEKVGSTAETKKDKAAKPDPLDQEIATLQRNVTLGRWPEVKKFLASLPKDEGKAAYQALLRSLQGMMPGMPGMPGMPEGGPEMPLVAPEMEMFGRPLPTPQAQMLAERHQFSPEDIVGIASVAPDGVDAEIISNLGRLVQPCLESGHVVENVVARFQQEAAKPKDAALTKRQCAQILCAARQAANAGVFLPSLEQAKTQGDLEALNLLAQHYLGMHEREQKLTWLEQAWVATQGALEKLASDKQRKDQEESLQLAVELAPRLKETMGQKWLDESFSKEPERGMNILATIGSLSSRGLQIQASRPEVRHKTLKLLGTAIAALLKAAPDRAQQWRSTLTLLAGVWLREGEFSYCYAQNASQLRRDRYGNYFFWDEEMFNRPVQQNPNQSRPIGLTDILEVRPSTAWLAQVEEQIKPRLAMVLCQLHLKVEEESQAFPYIEQLSKTNPRQARELASEFLRVWTKNHDLNSNRRQTNPYYYMFGFERRSDGIPLTRSKQERNLVELSDWVARLKKLPIGELDEELLTKAFTASHSSAEVYRSEAIEKVFGPMGGLKPRVLAGLAQQMRENLAGLWRKPEEQKDKKTNRKMKDIQTEVMRGYGVARATVEKALVKFPEDWSLALAKAAIEHDQVNFEQELGRDSEHAQRKLQALKGFAHAAQLYAKKVAEIPEEEQSTQVYEQWLYASLGAVDLGQITEDKVPDLKQPALIKQALKSLPGELADKHLARFATQLFARLSGVKPHIKYRYLQAGFDIVGDHKQAGEAKKVFEYYKDLITEIKLQARIDGSAEVGHQTPFGVYVFLQHTREIERESGGFGRYLQNQNTGTYFSYNYGRPTADYRDRFQTAATEALKEHFEVLSVTFETDKVHSRATEEYGWRMTPYAYLLLKARGPQVDRLPPLRLDLDFLDTSGYVVLPVESPAVPLSARANLGEPRPASRLEVTQTLDERQAEQGKLILEIKATAEGLVPELNQLLAVEPIGFEVANIRDQGVSVSRFLQDTDRVGIASERTWYVTLQADGERVPSQFHFPKARLGDIKMLYQRYDDADMVSAREVVELEARYGKRSYRRVWLLGGGALVACLVGLVLWRLLRRPRIVVESKWRLPATLTPFTAIALLERIREEGGLNATQKAEINSTIRSVEENYFAATAAGNGSVDLRSVTEKWLALTR